MPTNSVDDLEKNHPECFLGVNREMDTKFVCIHYVQAWRERDQTIKIS